MREFKNCSHVVKSCDMGKHVLDCPCRFLHETGTEHLDESLGIRNKELTAFIENQKAEISAMVKDSTKLRETIERQEKELESLKSRKPGRPKK